jgi:hypothetical protein
MHGIMLPRSSAPYAASDAEQGTARYFTWLSSSFPMVCNCMLEVPS